MWHDEVSHLTCWTKQSGGGEEMGEREKERGRKEREEEEGERSSTFSLDFSAIGLWVFAGARGEVLPRDESFT